MARRFARDNRGRFAPKGAGATARGGRLKTASGKKRATQKVSMLTGDRMSSTPQGTIGKTRKQREITMIDRPQGKRPAFNAGRAQQAAAISARKAPKAAAATKRIKAKTPGNTVANKTGQSKTLNKFNSRPVGTMVLGKGVNLVPSTKRVPLDIQRKSSDEAFARMATKTAKVRAAAPAKAAAKQTTAQRASRAASNQKRVIASIQAKGGRRPTPSRKQRRSILTAEAAKRFYSSGAIDRLNVNVKKPGFRLPRGMR